MAHRSLWARASRGRRSFRLNNRPNALLVVCSSAVSSFQKAQHFLQQQQASKMASSSLNLDECVVPKEEVVRFIKDCMKQVGTDDDDAECVAHHLMTADYRGHFSHGLNRLYMYIGSIKAKLTDVKAKPQIIKDFQAIALVSGCNGLGQVVGKYCMNLAIEKARKFGVGLVSTKRSNHYGICGYYTLMAVEQNMIGFSCTNTSPLMVPTGTRVAALGTNPLSLAMGASGGDEFVLDMATTAVALGKIELALRKEEPIPPGWAMDSHGAITTDAQAAVDSHTLMPLGGEENYSGYKGYGLALMVEVLCGILSDSHYGPNIRVWKHGDGIADLAHFFMAIDPEAFAPGSADRLAHLLQQLRKLPVKTEKNVQVPGDPERYAMNKVDREGGLHYHENQIKIAEEMANELGVEPLKLVKRNC